MLGGFRTRVVGRMLLLALVAAACAGAGARAAGAQPAQRLPLNVVVILSDDERVDGDSVMQNVRDLLARHGVTFTNYHVTTPMCGPSRASILLGRYSQHTGVLENFGPHSYPAFDQYAALPLWLQESGYQTALIGKYLNDYTLYGHHEIPVGWDDFEAIDSVPETRYYDYTLNENGRLVRYGHQPDDYSTTVLTEKATAFLRRVTAVQPFFLYFAPVTPHLPSIPAPGDQGRLENLAPIDSPAFNERDIGDKPWREWHRDLLKAGAEIYENNVRKRQLESLLALDRSVGEIVDTLRERRLLDRTVIIYTSDNGFLYGEHRLGGKVWPYEDSTHVPLVVRTPWTRANGTVNREQVLNIDLAPTIAALTGAQPLIAADGRSFLPFLRGETEPWRDAYLIEYLGRDMLRVGGPPPYTAVHTRRYLYVAYENGWRELYDLHKDPWELRNLAGTADHVRLEESLQRLLERLKAEQPVR